MVKKAHFYLIQLSTSFHLSSRRTMMFHLSGSCLIGESASSFSGAFNCGGVSETQWHLHWTSGWVMVMIINQCVQLSTDTLPITCKWLYRCFFFFFLKILAMRDPLWLRREAFVPESVEHFLLIIFTLDINCIVRSLQLMIISNVS